MGDTWVDPLHYVRGYSPQDGTLMDFGRQLVHRGSGEAVWSGSVSGNWQSSRSSSLVGDHNFTVSQDTAIRNFETGSFFGGATSPLSTVTNPRAYQMGGTKQQHLRELLNSYSGVQNVENTKPNVMVSTGLDNCAPARDPSYCMDYSTTGQPDIKYQLERELDFHRREAERRVWRNNFEIIPQAKMSADPNNVVSSEHQSVVNGYVSRGMSTALDHSLTSQHKSGIEYTCSISPTGVSSGHSHSGMVPGSRISELPAPSIYGSVLGLNSSVSTEQNSNSGLGYSSRILETSSSNGYASQACDVESDITSVVPSLSYELPDFHSAAFSYSNPVYEERVATNDSSGEPMDCLMGDFQAAVVPDAMSPAMTPIFKRSNWEIVNDGFDLLSHGSCPETSTGFPWQSDALVSDICNNGHSSMNVSSSFMLPSTPKLSSAVELSSADVLDEQTMEEFSLVPSVLSVQSNLLPSTGRISCDLQRDGGGSETISSQRDGSGSDTISTHRRVGFSEPISTHGTQCPAERNQHVKEVPNERQFKEEAALGEGGDRGTADKMDHAMRMMTRVMRFAEIVDSKDSKACNAALASVPDFCCVSGDYTQRVAHYFCEALSSRLASESGKAVAAEEPYQLPHDLLEDCKFTEACPYTKFVHLTANQALLEAVEGAESVHIIDVGTMQGVQWSALLQALVSPAGPKAAALPKKIRISGIASPKLGCNASESLLRTGRRLTEFAEVLGLQIEFQPILEEVQNLDPKSFPIREGEIVAVNLMLQLHQHTGEGGERLTRILKFVQDLKPKVVVLVEYEAAVNTETSDSQTRLLDSLKHYCAVFQSIEVLPRDCLERTRIERYILAREIRKMFSPTSDKGAMKHASFVQWKDLFRGLGFEALKPSHYSFSQARLLLWMYEGPYQILNNPESLSLSWHDRVMITVSAWHCA